MAALAYFVFSNNSGGVGSVGNTEAAGLPGGSTCNTCHSGGAFAPTTTVDIKNSAGTTVTQVTGDSVYTVTVSITPGSGTPSAYGLQAIFVSDSARNNAGTFQNLGTGKTTKTFTNGRVAVEHSTPSASGTFTFNWKAPVYCPGGTATLYVFGNAVNLLSGSGGDIGDGFTYQVTHTPSTPSALNQTAANVLQVELFPNPVVSNLNVTMELEKEAQYSLGIFGSNGQQISTQNFQGNAGNNRLNLDVNNLPVGTYRLLLQDEKGGKISRSFVKF